jgi:hypothetical protein
MPSGTRRRRDGAGGPVVGVPRFSMSSGSVNRTTYDRRRRCRGVEHGEEQRHARSANRSGARNMRSGANGIIGRSAWDGTRSGDQAPARRRGRDRPRGTRSTPHRSGVAGASRPSAGSRSSSRRAAIGVSARRARNRSSLVSIVRCRPVSDPRSRGDRRRAAELAGSTTSIAMTSQRRPSRPSAGPTSRWGDEVRDTTARPPRRRTRWSASIARARSTWPPSGDLAKLPARPTRCRRPPRIGTMRGHRPSR